MQPLIHVGLEAAERAAAFLLGAEQGEVGVLQQHLRRARIVREQSDDGRQDYQPEIVLEADAAKNRQHDVPSTGMGVWA